MAASGVFSVPFATPHAISLMTETRLGSSNRFQGLDATHAEFVRAAALTGRCWPGSFGDRVSGGIEHRQHVNTDWNVVHQ